jgi:hypothetical protein
MQRRARLQAGSALVVKIESPARHGAPLLDPSLTIRHGRLMAAEMNRSPLLVFFLLIASCHPDGSASHEDVGFAAPAPSCVEGLLTADNQARCKALAYREYASNASELEQRRRSAQELHASGDKNFAEARYGKAFIDYSTSNVWIPSSKTMIKMGDSIFHLHASGRDLEGRAQDEKGCSKDFLRAAELYLPQSYDAALAFNDFERKHAGLQMSQQEIDSVRKKSGCLKQLADSYSDNSEACVERHRISRCLRRAE